MLVLLVAVIVDVVLVVVKVSLRRARAVPGGPGRHPL
jgi:hypothetical protein